MVEPHRIDCLIFSKDRPAQLDLLLRSIDRFATHLYATLTVLVALGNGYRYSQVRDDHDPSINWWGQGDFEQGVRVWLGTPRWPPYVSFLCDDDVFYRTAELPETVPWSFRGGDYDYPFSVDGNVYRRDRVLELLDGLAFSNPTELEARAHEKAVATGWLGMAELPHGEPCLTGIPLNRVSASSQMPHLGVHEYDLNERFLAGDRLALPPPGDYGAHAMIEPVWEGAKV